MCTGRPRAGHTCRPLSTSTTRKVHYIIRGALERAVRWRHLGVNKAAMADFERGLLPITRSNAQPQAGLKEKHTKTGQARKITSDTHTVEL